MDEEWAARVIELEAQGQQVPRGADPEQITPLGYTPEVAYLSLIADRQIAIRDAIYQSSGNDAPPSQPLPTPKTALDRARESNAHSELMAIDRQLRGG